MDAYTERMLRIIRANELLVLLKRLHKKQGGAPNEEHLIAEHHKEIVEAQKDNLEATVNAYRMLCYGSTDVNKFDLRI